ncbi:Z1 domain-containing protein [Lentisalinibacter salinarum]|uniref:Z1 domain-containing protein n=1 Tax=Lentisalinibacter salinarum TaxID=2992239 RepID=UPI00386D9CF2
MELEAVARIAIDLARAEEDPISLETLQTKVDQLLLSPAFGHLEPDRVVKIARSMINVTVPDDTEILADADTSYRPWVATRFAEAEKQYWKRYYTFLAEKRGLPLSALRKLDVSTDRVLDLLRDPKDTNDWDRRGLIVGDVQSGKTANYIGLICKAIDAGYKLIVILAGAHNNLRAQTQIRIDEGVLGFDTRYARNLEQESARSQKIGVGNLPPKHIRPVVNSLTTSNDNGDFRKSAVEGTLIGLGGDPNILCIKKNKSILENLIVWLRTFADPLSDGSRVVRDAPLLLIDDEADYASVNTADYVDENGNVIPDRDPTAINKKIREILGLFSRSAYVGYTATPFANIFIHNETKEAIAKEDLFPRSFIRNVHPPSNYIGAERFFGLGNGGDQDDDLVQIAYVHDAQTIFPPKHKKDLVVRSLPASLKEAILDFFLACSIRAGRGQISAHNSMLIHVTRFTDVQHQVYELVHEFVLECIQSIRYDSDSTLRAQLRRKYDDKFRRECRSAAALLDLEDCEDLEWAIVDSHLLPAIEKIETREINGSAGDVLDYLDHTDGLNVIAVGGDKLSRGLTLEGLTVSYFLRASKMYDTLLQMGRWFGYRNGYADVCRLYTTPSLVGWFQHVAGAMAKLRDEFDRMAAIKATPEDFGLRVATHPDGMMITGPAKMRAAKEHKAGYNNTTAISTTFDCTDDVVLQNFRHTEDFIHKRQASSETRSGLTLWLDQSGREVSRFLDNLTVPPTVVTSNTSLIAQYINEMVRAEGELTEWTIALATGGRGRAFEIAGINTNLTKRVNINTNDYRSADGRYTVKTVLSPTHEMVDLTESQIVSAKAEAGTEGTPSAPYIRAQRNPATGLLIIYPIEAEDLQVPLIGFVVSFPNSRNGHQIAFRVNKVFEQNYMQDMFDVD